MRRTRLAAGAAVLAAAGALGAVWFSGHLPGFPRSGGSGGAGLGPIPAPPAASFVDKAFCRQAATFELTPDVPAPVAFSAAAAAFQSLAHTAPAQVAPDVDALASALAKLALRLPANSPALAQVSPAALDPGAGADLAGAAARLSDYGRRLCQPLAAAGELVSQSAVPSQKVRVSVAIDRTAFATDRALGPTAPLPAAVVRAEVSDSVLDGKQLTAGRTATTCSTDFASALASPVRPCQVLSPSAEVVNLVANQPFGPVGPSGVTAGAYQFAGWRGACSGTNATCAFNAAGRPWVIAMYRPVPMLRILTVGSGEVATGVEGASGSAVCAPDPTQAPNAAYPVSVCDRWYTAGEVVHVDAQGGPGGSSIIPAFTGWSGAVCRGGGQRCTFRMPAEPTTVIAHFQYYWCPGPGGTGRIFPAGGGGRCVGASGTSAKPTGPVDPPSQVTAPTCPEPGTDSIWTALDRLADQLAPVSLTPGINDGLHRVVATNHLPGRPADCG